MGINIYTMYRRSQDNIIQGNFIGTDKTGNIASGEEFGNWFNGIDINGNHNIIGSDKPGGGNVIAWNGRHHDTHSWSKNEGVSIGGAYNSVKGNIIAKNKTSGIAIDKKWHSIC